MPAAIADRLHDEMARIVADPEVHEKIASIGLIPNPPMSIEEMQRYIKAERVKWGGMVKQLGLEGSQ